MIALLQRVSSANIVVSGRRVADIDAGLLVFIAVEPNDAAPQAERLLERLLGYRVFTDAQGRMNLSVQDIAGALLLVPQFTLAADTTQGMRPSFATAAAPEAGRHWFDYLLEQARARYPKVEAGIFGADMAVALVNEGPATFYLRV